jgi:hypothetical protein
VRELEQLDHLDDLDDEQLRRLEDERLGWRQRGPA